MKRWLLFVLALPLLATAQIQNDLIKKYKIRKVIETAEKESGKTTTTYYFDAQGTDTAVLEEGIRSRYTQITYDNKARKTKAEEFGADGKPLNTYTYTYTKDGSYKEDLEDAAFHMTSSKWFNAKGKLLKLKIPDGSIVTYTLNSQGDPVRKEMFSTDDKKKYIITVKYKYDNKSRPTEAAWSNGIRYTYKYDNRGLLTEYANGYKNSAGKFVVQSKFSYQYE